MARDTESAWDWVRDQECVSLSISPQDSERVSEEKLDELTATPPPCDRVTDCAVPRESACDSDTPRPCDDVSELERVAEENALSAWEEDVIV